MTPRAALYLRVSTPEQVEAGSIEQQEKACRTLAAERGWEVVEVFADAGASAYKPDAHRPQYNAMLAAADRGEFDWLVAWAPDRLSRGQEQNSYQALVWSMKKAGIGVTTVNGGDADAHGPFSDVFNALFTVQSNLESAIKSERGKSGNRSRVERGQYVGREPFGYTTEAGAMIPDPETHREVQWIFDQWNSGTSQREIARQLGARGVPTKTSTRAAGRRGRKSEWHQATVRQILLNPTYLGKITHLGEVYAGVHEALVTQEAFDTAARRLSGRRRSTPTDGSTGDGATVSKARPDGRATHSGRDAQYHLLSRLLVCGLCGEPMNARLGELRKDGTRYMRYQCRRANGQLHGQRCSMRPVDRGLVDRAVMEHFQERLLDVEAIQEQLGAQHAADVARLEVTAAAADQARQRAEADYLRALDKVMQEVLDDEDLAHYRAARDSARTASAEADAALQQARDNPPVTSLDVNVAERLRDIREAIGGSLDKIDTATQEDIASARAAMKATFEEFRIYPGDISCAADSVPSDHPLRGLFFGGPVTPDPRYDQDPYVWPEDATPWPPDNRPIVESSQLDPEATIAAGPDDEPIRWSLVPFLRDDVIESWGLDGQANVRGFEIRLSDAGLARTMRGDEGRAAV